MMFSDNGGIPIVSSISSKPMSGIAVNGIGRGSFSKSNNGVIEKVCLSLFPNPCSNATRLRYQINDKQLTICDLFAISGIRIERLINEVQMPGEHELGVNLTDIPAGVYIIRLQAGEQVAVRKLIKM